MDVNVISELRKRRPANEGVLRFLRELEAQEGPAFISVATLGERRRGVELIRRRGDISQTEALERWLHTVVAEYADHVLPFGPDEAQVWGASPHSEHTIEKQIAATALIFDLIVVARNGTDFSGTGVAVRNPFL